MKWPCKAHCLKVYKLHSNLDTEFKPLRDYKGKPFVAWDRKGFRKKALTYKY